jgi:hypothetical protein
MHISDLDATLSSMLLCEPGSHVDASTENLMRITHETAFWLLADELGEGMSDRVALMLISRLHDALTQAGHIVKVYP